MNLLMFEQTLLQLLTKRLLEWLGSKHHGLGCICTFDAVIWDRLEVGAPSVVECACNVVRQSILFLIKLCDAFIFLLDLSHLEVFF